MHSNIDHKNNNNNKVNINKNDNNMTSNNKINSILDFDPKIIPNDTILIDTLLDQVLQDNKHFYWNSNAIKNLKIASYRRKWGLICKWHSNNTTNNKQNNIIESNITSIITIPIPNLPNFKKNLHLLEKNLRDKIFLSIFINSIDNINNLINLSNSNIINNDSNLQYVYLNCFLNLSKNEFLRLQLINNLSFINYLINLIKNYNTNLKNYYISIKLLLLLTYIDDNSGPMIVWNLLKDNLSDIFNCINFFILNPNKIIETSNNNNSISNTSLFPLILSDVKIFTKKISITLIYILISIIDSKTILIEKNNLIIFLKNLKIHNILSNMKKILNFIDLNFEIDKYLNLEKLILLDSTPKDIFIKDTKFGLQLQQIIIKIKDNNNSDLEITFTDILNTILKIFQIKTDFESNQILKLSNFLLIKLLDDINSFNNNDNIMDNDKIQIFLKDSISNLLDKLQSHDVAIKAFDEMKLTISDNEKLKDKIIKLESLKNIDKITLIDENKLLNDTIIKKDIEIDKLNDLIKKFELNIKNLKFKNDSMTSKINLVHSNDNIDNHKKSTSNIFDTLKSPLYENNNKTNLNKLKKNSLAKSKGLPSLSSFLNNNNENNSIIANPIALYPHSQKFNLTNSSIDLDEKYSRLPTISTTFNNPNFNSTQLSLLSTVSTVASPEFNIDNNNNPLSIRSNQSPYLTSEYQNSEISITNTDDTPSTVNSMPLPPPPPPPLPDELNILNVSLKENSISVSGIEVSTPMLLNGNNVPILLPNSEISSSIPNSNISDSTSNIPPPPPMPSLLTDSNTTESENNAPPPPPPPPMPLLLSDSNSTINDNGVPPPPPIPTMLSVTNTKENSVGTPPPPPPPPPPPSQTLITNTKLPNPSIHEDTNKLVTPSPKKNLKQIHWEKVPKTEESLWDDDNQRINIIKELNDSGIFTKVENIFQIKDIIIKSVKPQDTSKDKLLSLMSRELAQQFGINLHIFSQYEPEELFLKVLECDPLINQNLSVIEFFNNEDLTSIPANIGRLYAPYGTDYLSDDEPEKDFKLLTRMDQIFLLLCYNLRTYWKERSQCLLLLLTYEKDYYDLMSKLEKLDEAISAIKNSTKLKEVLYIIVAIGNYMNKKDVEGIKLSSLSKLTFIKSSDDKKLSFMHFIEQLIRDKYPEIYDFTDDLKKVENLGNVTLDHLRLEYDELSKKISTVNNTIEKGRLSDPKKLHPQDLLLSKVKYKITRAENKKIILQDKYFLTNRSLENIMKYFGEDSFVLDNKMLFLKSITDFLLAFKKCSKENIEREDAERVYEQRRLMLQNRSQTNINNATDSEDNENSSRDDTEDEEEDVVEKLLKKLRGVEQAPNIVRKRVTKTQTQSHISDDANDVFQKAKELKEGLANI